MKIPESRRNETLHRRIAGEHVTVKIEWVAVEVAYTSFLVASQHDALVAAHIYNGRRSTIERATDGRFLVVVYPVD